MIFCIYNSLIKRFGKRARAYWWNICPLAGNNKTLASEQWYERVFLSTSYHAHRNTQQIKHCRFSLTFFFRFGVSFCYVADGSYGQKNSATVTPRTICCNDGLRWWYGYINYSNYVWQSTCFAAAAYLVCS